MKIQKKLGGSGDWVPGRVGGLRVDVNEKLKVFGKFTKKNRRGGGGSGGGQVVGVGLVGGQGGCERNVGGRG